MHWSEIWRPCKGKNIEKVQMRATKFMTMLQTISKANTDTDAPSHVDV